MEHHQHSVRPSRQFIKRGSIAVGIVALVLIAQTSWVKGLFHPKKSGVTVVPSVTIGDIVTKDTNGNGIADWEERLWGLDPTVLYTNGVSNKQIIEDKKKALGVPVATDTSLNETDQIAQQLFALTAALGQSEEIDNATLKEISSKIGDSVHIQTAGNQYSVKDVTTVPTTVPTLRAYYATMQAITARQQPVADIDTIATALQTEDPSIVADLSASTAAYQKVARDLRAVPVPIGLAPYHLQIMNSFAGIAESFTYMQQMQDNSIVALVGVATYKTYSTRLDTALFNMTDYFTKYGILNQ